MEERTPGEHTLSNFLTTFPLSSWCCTSSVEKMLFDHSTRSGMTSTSGKKKVSLKLQRSLVPQLDPAAKKAWYNINFSHSETGLVQNRFEFFSGLQLYRKEVRTNSDSRICTCSILCGLVSAPSLPPESLGQIGFAVVDEMIEQHHPPPGPWSNAPRRYP